MVVVSFPNLRLKGSRGSGNGEKGGFDAAQPADFHGRNGTERRQPCQRRDESFASLPPRAMSSVTFEGLLFV
jgi:hypothetical protein